MYVHYDFCLSPHELVSGVPTDKIIEYKKKAARQEIGFKITENLQWKEKYVGEKWYYTDAVAFPIEQWFEFRRRLEVAKTLMNRESVSLIQELLNHLENESL